MPTQTGLLEPTRQSGVALPLRCWLANPLQMGSVVPSSPALCRRVVQQVRRSGDEWVIELGAGTGVVSRALLEGGLPPERVTVVEIVSDMADHLRLLLPGVDVVEGDARALPARKLGLVAKREAWTPLNVPPASVWRYLPA